MSEQWPVPSVLKTERAATGVTERTVQCLIINLSLKRLLPRIFIAF